MTPQNQLHKHDPANGVYGDCGRTAIACLLDLHPSPHFWNGEKADNPTADEDLTSLEVLTYMVTLERTIQ